MTSCNVRRLSSFVCTPPIQCERWERYLNRGEGYRKLKDKSRENSGKRPQACSSPYQGRLGGVEDFSDLTLR